MRRLFWLGVGTVAGASGTVWAERKIKQRVEALSPDHALRVATVRAREAGKNVAAAVTEGRSAMRQREQELLDRRDGQRWSTGTPSLRVVGGASESDGPRRRTGDHR
ncbi:MAG: hypothetical protein ACKOYM_11260 [Actinomycetes bacterium]